MSDIGIMFVVVCLNVDEKSVLVVGFSVNGKYSVVE